MHIAQFALFQGFRMENFREGVIDLETAMERHDHHREIRRVLECLEEVQQVPNSFEGLPDELLDDAGKPIKVPQIGDRIAYPRRDGTESVGKIEDVLPIGESAYVVVADENRDQRVVVSMPLTEREAKAAKKLGGAIFGKPEGPHEVFTDPLRFYDKMLENFRDFSHESLMTQLSFHSQKESFRSLPRDELRIRAAREMTKAMHSRVSRDE